MLKVALLEIFERDLNKLKDEINLYQQYKDYYSDGFYIAKRNE